MIDPKALVPGATYMWRDVENARRLYKVKFIEMEGDKAKCQLKQGKQYKKIHLCDVRSMLVIDAYIPSA